MVFFVFVFFCQLQTAGVSRWQLSAVMFSDCSSWNKSCHLSAFRLTIKTPTHKNRKQHARINSYNYIPLQLFCSRRFHLDACCTQRIKILLGTTGKSIYSSHGYNGDSWVNMSKIICHRTFSLCGGDSGSSALSSSA